MVQEENKPIADEVLENEIPLQEEIDDIPEDYKIKEDQLMLDGDDELDQVKGDDTLPRTEDDPAYLQTSPQVVGYNSTEEQGIIYDYVLSNLNPISDTILDLGCARGDFYRHVQDVYEVDPSYHGVDINQPLIGVAKELSPGTKFTCVNWFDLDGNYAADWVINIQSSTILYEPVKEDFDPVLGLRNTIIKMLELADVGIVISLLSTLAPDAYDGDYLVYDPIETLDWALNEYGQGGGNVKLDHSMTDAIFTLTIYK